MNNVHQLKALQSPKLEGKRARSSSLLMNDIYRMFYKNQRLTFDELYVKCILMHIDRGYHDTALRFKPYFNSELAITCDKANITDNISIDDFDTEPFSYALVRRVVRACRLSNLPYYRHLLLTYQAAKLLRVALKDKPQFQVRIGWILPSIEGDGTFTIINNDTDAWEAYHYHQENPEERLGKPMLLVIDTDTDDTYFYRVTF